MRIAFAWAAAAATLLGGPAAHAFTLSLAGLDIEPSFGVSTVSFVNSDPSAISSVTFDFTYVANAPSWSEELVIQIEHVPSGTALVAGTVASPTDHCSAVFASPCDVDLGSPLGTSAPFTAFLSFDLLVADGSGLWVLSVSDGFDDPAAFPDGSFEDGSRVIINPAVVPLPAAGWLLGSAMLGLFGLRRRRD